MHFGVAAAGGPAWQLHRSQFSSPWRRERRQPDPTTGRAARAAAATSRHTSRSRCAMRSHRTRTRRSTSSSRATRTELRRPLQEAPRRQRIRRRGETAVQRRSTGSRRACPGRQILSLANRSYVTSIWRTRPVRTRRTRRPVDRTLELAALAVGDRCAGRLAEAAPTRRPSRSWTRASTRRTVGLRQSRHRPGQPGEPRAELTGRRLRPRHVRRGHRCGLGSRIRRRRPEGEAASRST